ncbi:MAG: hypothetical protein SF028_10880 [Candidatus Sumerlaeia bacterium]|nr:hypothetical protein [Candidatus Sumerlaeia bacterium]
MPRGLQNFFNKINYVYWVEIGVIVAVVVVVAYCLYALGVFNKKGA